MKGKRGEISPIILNLRKYKLQLLFLLLFSVFLFLRFYRLTDRAQLGWDQADSAWAAYNILKVNPLRLEGVPIKGNTGMVLGPLYYYLITPFYYISGLDMVASPVFAGVVSAVSFGVFFIITGKLFGLRTSLIASVLYIFSMSVISADRTQAAFVLISVISYMAFYFLYKFLTGDIRSLLFFTATVGFGFHIHFTTIFYLPIFLLAIPFFPRSRRLLKYGLWSALIFLLFLSPMVYSVFFVRGSGSGNLVSYLDTSYHGFHLRRVLQLVYDAFISFQALLPHDFLRPLVFLVFPLFTLVYYRNKPQTEKRNILALYYLILLWILVPWLVLSMYNGELTDYYFSLPRNIGFAMGGYIFSYACNKRFLPLTLAVFVFLIYFAWYNLTVFFKVNPGNYYGIKQTALGAIKDKRKIPFHDHDPVYYMYYQLMSKKH